MLGNLAALLLPWVPPVPLAAAACVAGLAGLGRPRARLLAALLLGCAACLLPLARYERARLHAADEERLLLDCRIVTLPAASALDTQFDADCRGTRAPRRQLRLRVGWYAAPSLRSGERWRLLAALHAPRTNSNPGAADGARALRRQRIHGYARVLASPLNRRLAAGRWSIDRLREDIAADIARAVPERDAAALIAALAVGDTRRVSGEQWRVFNATGLTHLVAISGLHVTLFGVVAAALARRLWGRSSTLVRRVPRESCALLVGLAAASGYALLAGFSVPAQRTLIMLAAWCATRLLRRSVGAAPPLAVAMIGVLLLDPFAPLAPGFWLSFVAVAALLSGTGTLTQARGLPARLRELWRAQWIVAVALVPVSALAFGALSWAGLALNLVAIPLFSGLLVPLILGGVAASLVCAACARPFYATAAHIIDFCAPALQAVADQDAALWRLTAPAWWHVLAAAAVLVALLPWAPRLRLAGALVLVPALWPLPQRPATGELELTLLDTGRSLAVIVRTQRHSLIYDLGEGYRADGTTTLRSVVPALRSFGIERIDRLLLPRLTRARSAGATALLATLPVGMLQAGSDGPLPPEYRACGVGEAWEWDAVRFELLAAQECVLRIAAGGDAVLLTGELDPAGQRELVRRGLPPTGVVVLPRHGSAAGFEPALLAATRARVALVANSAAGAAGAGVAATLRAWRDTGTVVRVTGEEGAIRLRIPPAVGIMPRPVALEHQGRCGKSCAPADR
jgi:competence protein ComEC